MVLLDGLPPGWSTKDISIPAIPRHYKIIHEDGRFSYATMDNTFTLENHIAIYWRQWGDKYGC